MGTSSFLCESIRNAYGGTFDKDGLCFTCGDEEGHVRLCFWKSERDEWSMCNLEKKHTAAVHRTFFTYDQSHIASFSDDRTVRLWDPSNKKCVNTFEQIHTDIIRAGCVSPVSPNTLLSGGYDGTAKMLDIRTNSTVFEFHHGFPIESVMFHPKGSVFASCGGPRVTIWDAFMGRKLATLPERVRNVTCLQMACRGRRLLSGGWDQEVHIVDMATYRIVHSLRFPHKICSMAVTPDTDMLVVGMCDGNIAIQHMDLDREIEMPQETAIPKMMLEPVQTHQHYRGSPDSHEVKEMIRKQEYSEALRTVFTTDCVNETPECTFRLLRELQHLQCMDRALKDQPNEFLKKFVSFLIRHINDERFIRLLIDISNILLNVYEDSISSLGNDVKKGLVKLKKKVVDEYKLMKEALELQGAIELF
ncbi:hypothetical protein HA402_007259 [Bradysia odoriphaga]|nr:hypothetical protein HA402_007259 [Bradysia odoriphaga]